jgi:hypothetical protein
MIPPLCRNSGNDVVPTFASSSPFNLGFYVNQFTIAMEIFSDIETFVNLLMCSRNVPSLVTSIFTGSSV